MLGTLATRGGGPIALDDHLVTRTAELVAHGDDLAEVARRHSSTSAMIRALARVDRADDPRPRTF